MHERPNVAAAGCRGTCAKPPRLLPPRAVPSACGVTPALLLPEPLAGALRLPAALLRQAGLLPPRAAPSARDVLPALPLPVPPAGGLRVCGTRVRGGA